MAHGDSPYDNHEILEEMGFCQLCGEHAPCGCEPLSEDAEDDLKLLDLNDPIDGD